MSKVSIIMPAYNCENIINRSIESIVNQTYPNFELIIVDDGSIDGTSFICDNYSLKDQRIKVIHQVNKGASAARNTGISRASGEYVMFIDADDTYDLNMLERMVSVTESTNVDLVICGIKNQYHKSWITYKEEIISHSTEVWGKRATILERVDELFKSGLFTSCFNKIYLADKIKKNGIYMQRDLDIGEDFLFNLEYLNCSNSVCLIEQPLYNYFIGENYLTSKYRENMYELRKRNIEQLKKFYNDNGITDISIDFMYIKLAYACFMQMFHKDNNSNFLKKLKYIKSILSTSQVSYALQHIDFKALSFFEKVLVTIMKTKSEIVLYFFSKILRIIRGLHVFKWKRTNF